MTEQFKYFPLQLNFSLWTSFAQLGKLTLWRTRSLLFFRYYLINENRHSNSPKCFKIWNVSKILFGICNRVFLRDISHAVQAKLKFPVTNNAKKILARYTLMDWRQSYFLKSFQEVFCLKSKMYILYMIYLIDFNFLLLISLYIIYVYKEGWNHLTEHFENWCVYGFLCYLHWRISPPWCCTDFCIVKSIVTKISRCRQQKMPKLVLIIIFY